MWKSVPLKEKVIVVAPNCPACDAMEQILREKGVLKDYKVVDASTAEGVDFAKRLGIMAVPDCVVIVEEKDGVKARRCTQEEFEDILR